VTQLNAALTRNINLDEYQFVANGWDVFRGLRPYRDFWDNHGPAANYFYAIPFLCWPAVHDVLIVLRLVSFCLTLATAVCTGWMARQAFPALRNAGKIAMALLLASPMFLDKALEIRGDVVVTWLWTMGLALMFLAFRSRGLALFFFAGIALGATLWFTPKGLFIVGGGLLILVVDGFMRKPHRWHGVLLTTAGVALAVLAMVLWLHATDLWAPFVQLCLVESVGRSRTLSISPFTGAIEEHPFWMGATLLGIGIGSWFFLRRKPLSRGELWLWPVAALLLIYYFVILPTRHRQSLLPLHPVVAAMCVGLVWRFGRTRASLCVARWLPRRNTWPIILGALLAWQLYQLRSTGREAQPEKAFTAQIAYANRLATAVPPEEMVLTGEGPPLFRPAPLHAHVLVNYLRERYAQGAAGWDIPAALIAQSVRFVAIDPRLRTLPPRELHFFRDNYLPVKGTAIGKKRVLLAAGKLLTATETKTTFTIAIPRHYWVFRADNSSGPLAIDGEPTTCCRYLASGAHVLETADVGSTIVLSSLRPERLDWQAIAEGGPAALRE
jgi:hypothetical protein